MSNIKFGDYPAEYDPAKHGPYDPARYYGKPDTPFSDLKLKEVPAWIGRREKGPRQLMGLFSRAFWRWQHKYVLPKKTGIAPIAQIVVGGSMFFYYLNYYRIRGHRNYKYH
ncbi:putative ATP synthase subunit f, mitochondrial [Hylaeus anthracinus]|uniref:putative ATP synthase subunit f, mitochondrial n=1 Tax=Hylaeus anthracinus TaxID=313031 RepID=UPI0023BA2E78|nr:putative ATP synthase subunit f, mitochondrial [Hylaeus anthracinus]